MITTKPQALQRLKAALGWQGSVEELERLLDLVIDDRLAELEERISDLEANAEIVELNFDEEA